MRQDDYILITKCIQYGAPAVAPDLLQALNTVIENSNQLVELKREQAEQARKAEIEALEAKKVNGKPATTK